MFAKLKKLITISRSLFIYNDPERNRSRPLRGFRKRVRLGESRRRPAMHRLSPDSSGIGQDLHSRRFAMRRHRHSRVRARVSENKNIRTTASRPAVRTSAIISNRGEGGIRTRGGVAPTQTFQVCTLNHSDTSPKFGFFLYFICYIILLQVCRLVFRSFNLSNLPPSGVVAVISYPVAD